jgi:hypothetical protein
MRIEITNTVRSSGTDPFTSEWMFDVVLNGKTVYVNIGCDEMILLGRPLMERDISHRLDLTQRN